MRKFFAILLVYTIIIGIVPLYDVFAIDGNIIPDNNATFESGKTDWKAFSGGKVEITDNPDGKGKVLKYSGYPEKNWAAFTLDIKPYIQSAFDGKTTLYIAMDVYTTGESKNLQLLIRTEKAEDFSLCKGAEKNYCALPDEETKVAFESNTWNRFEIEITITEDDIKSGAKFWNLCFNGLPLTKGDIYVDNVYIGAEPDPILASQPKETNAPIPILGKITRSDKTLVGAIRWDAFTKSTKDGNDVASQVANVLSPAKYHSQAPFFASIEKDGTVSIPEYTLKTWEKEADYAVKGGLDYFAYLWYETLDAMSTPRKMHLQSSKKDDIKMVAILETIRSTKTMEELFSAMQDSCYITLSGQPVLFIYDVPTWDKAKITQIRQMAANAGIEKSIYIVGMITNEKTLLSNLEIGLDALSWYGTAPTKAAQPFSELAKACEDFTVSVGSKGVAFEYDIIPCLTTGRDCRGRIETPVTWIGGDPNAQDDKDKPYGNKYSLQPTKEELVNHITFMYNYIQENPQVTKPNMLLAYGWNEHEEGGWLCPTILCDENGNPILDSNGKTQANTERIDTLKATLDSLKNATPKPSATATPDITATPTPAGTADNNTFNPLFIVIPAVIVVLAAVTVGIIIIFKKKKG